MNEEGNCTKLALVTNVKPALLACAGTLQEAQQDNILLVLGGGTVLASRWHHRVSTDLDFFLYADRPAAAIYMESVANRLQTHPAIADLNQHSYHLNFRIGDTQASIFTVPADTIRDIPEQEITTHIPLESTATILSRKLTGRVMGNGEFTVRDFYDFCVAWHQEPNAYDLARQSLTEQQLTAIGNELKSLTHSEGLRNDKPLIEPVYPQLAKKIWQSAAALILDGHLCSTLFEPVKSEQPD